MQTNIEHRIRASAVTLPVTMIMSNTGADDALSSVGAGTELGADVVTSGESMTMVRLPQGDPLSLETSCTFSCNVTGESS